MESAPLLEETANAPDKRGKSLLLARMEAFILSNHALVNIDVSDTGKHVVQWQKATGFAFREPFAFETLRKLRDRVLRRTMLATDLDTLLRYASRKKRLSPSGFIFHVGRCGSTVVSNMLNSIDEHFVLSEPYLPLSSMLRYPERFTTAEWLGLTRATLAAHSGSAPFVAKRFFVKLFNGDVLAAPVLRQAAPGVPEVFLYRDPVEIAVSLLNLPTMPWLWHQHLTDLPLEHAVELPMTEIAARLVGRLLRAMCEHLRDDTLLLNYSQIGTSTPELLMRHFGIAQTDRNCELMSSCLDSYAKDRSKKYVADSENKQARATPSIRNAVAAYAMHPYIELEKFRKAKEGIC